MPRSYHIEIAQHAADTDKKWIDNLLSHFDVRGVARARQGVPRRISMEGIYHIALIRRLNHGLGVSVAAAVPLAARLLEDQDGRTIVAPSLELRLDIGALQRRVARLVEEASEMSAPARRGRPPRQLA